MKNTTIINRTTANGTNWEIVFNGFSASLYMNGHYSGYSFRSVAEANAHLDAVDARIRAQREFIPVAIPADYYNDFNRYYGD